MAYVVMTDCFWKNLRRAKKWQALKLEELNNGECLNLEDFYEPPGLVI